MVCVGAGQQRFQFREERRFQGSGDKCAQKQKLKSRREENTCVEVPYQLNTKVTLLANSLLDTIKPSTNLKFNLAWSYGIFLEEIPRRLGKNEALDTSVAALVSAHSDLCSRRREVSIDTLNKYSCALKTLREYLDAPITACATETLCAVMLLLICQGFIGRNGTHNLGSHSEGAAQILKARRFYNQQDDFECKLVASLRGPVVFEGVIYNKINFTPSEWKTLVENHMDGVTPEGRLMRCLARVPNLMDRGKKVRRGECHDLELLEEARTNYQIFKTGLEELRSKMEGAKPSMEAMGSSFTVHAYYERMYAFGLAVGIILNCVVRAVGVKDHELTAESERFSKEIIELSEPAKRFRPLWSSYMILCLMAAWIGTTDFAVRRLAEEALEDYGEDFPRAQVISISMATYLEQIFRKLHLLDMGSSPEV